MQKVFVILLNTLHVFNINKIFTCTQAIWKRKLFTIWLWIGFRWGMTRYMFHHLNLPVQVNKVLISTSSLIKKNENSILWIWRWISFHWGITRYMFYHLKLPVQENKVLMTEQNNGESKHFTVPREWNLFAL